MLTTTNETVRDVMYAACRQWPIESELARRVDLDVWTALDRVHQSYLAVNVTAIDDLPVEVRRAVTLMLFVRGPIDMAFYASDRVEG